MTEEISCQGKTNANETLKKASAREERIRCEHEYRAGLRNLGQKTAAPRERTEGRAFGLYVRKISALENVRLTGRNTN
jgi:hypothetical protein